MIDVFVVGALHLDVVVDAPRLPMLDETLFGGAVAYRFGGKGGNQALAAARMGAHVAMAGRVGDDGFADQIMAQLMQSGVEHGNVRQVSGATGMSVAIVENSGEYGAVVVSGVNQTIEPDEVKLGDAKIVLLQNEIPEAVNLGIVRQKHSGTRIVLNAAPARATSPDLLRAVDVLIVNRVEAAQMTGMPPNDLNLEQAAKSLHVLGPGAVVVTAGAEGAVVFDGNQTEIVRPPVRASGSAHGAGDAFVGALAAELADGASLADATQFAASSAAFYVHTSPDARPSITRAMLAAWRANTLGLG